MRYDVGLLLDFYGQLLPERAREVLERYYCDDLSMAEIAEQLEISRQAVHDRLHQGLNNLTHYEQELGLLARYRSQKNLIRSAIEAIDQGKITVARDRLEQMEQSL
ncbi:MAG: sigma factor-like helix-turn-helix DNA-binding protein [Bacillota bacterium]|nr:sigma factor-like helix-turn-helix DNA-binding protein [Bacillota bacterium]